MRITKIEGYNWPLNIPCFNENCPASFEVSMPDDMFITRDYKYESAKGAFEDVKVPVETGRHYMCKCPLCGNKYEIHPDLIPNVILTKIRFDKDSAAPIGF